MYTYSSKVVRVIDGDTVVLDIDLGFGIILSKQHVRLYGINAPESRTRDLVEKEQGIKSKEFLKVILPIGYEITIKTKIDKKGKFGRILGSLFIGEKSINEMMVDEGYATTYFGGSR